MQSLKIALIQLAWNGSRKGMMNHYRSLIAQASEGGAALVCLPEFSLLPYFPGTRAGAGFSWAEPLQGGMNDHFFGEMAKTHGVTIISSIFEKPDENTIPYAYYDTAVIHGADGKQIGHTRKVHIPSGEGYHETDFFEGYDEYPVHNIGAATIATPTCYDQWFPELARIYSMNGAEFIFYPTAIGSEPNDPTLDSSEQWQTIMRGHAIANGIYIGAANRVGHENAVTFYGSSFVCDPQGRILAQAGRDTTEVIFAELDPVAISHWREFFPLLHQRQPQTYGRLLEHGVDAAPPGWLSADHDAG